MSNKPYKKFPREMDESWRPGWTSPPGDTLRELIEMRGWTQALLAREIGWSLKHVNRWRWSRSTSPAEYAVMRRLCEAMQREGDYRVGIARAALAPSATAGDDASPSTSAGKLTDGERRSD
jgi:HTH-type transcriptional regulator/antitoxin HigA